MLHPLGDVGVELEFGEVAERDALADGVVLGGQLDGEGARQPVVRGIRSRQPIGGAGLTGADRLDVDIADVGAAGRPLND